MLQRTGCTLDCACLYELFFFSLSLSLSREGWNPHDDDDGARDTFFFFFFFVFFVFVFFFQKQRARVCILLLLMCREPINCEELFFRLFFSFFFLLSRVVKRRDTYTHPLLCIIGRRNPSSCKYFFARVLMQLPFYVF